MGCLTVLGIGFAALFVFMKPVGVPVTPAAAIIAAPPSEPAVTPAPRAPGIQVEPMRAAAAPAAGAAAAPKLKAPPRAVKVARSPSASRPAAALQDEAGTAAEGADSEESPKPKTAARETRERSPAPATEEADER